MKNSLDAAKVLSNYFDLDLNSAINRINEDIDLLDIIEDFKIDLNHIYHKETLLTCRHATTADDNLESVRKMGLLNLKQMLEERTPLSDFLLLNSISVNVRDRQFIYKGQILPIYSLRKHNLEEEYIRCNSYHLYENNSVLKKESYHDAIYWLYLKLYYDDCETEVFLNGGFEEIYDYDSVRYSPEILNTIENIVRYLDDVPNYYLQHAWSDRKNCKYYILEFDVPIESFAKSTLHSTFERFWEISEIAERFNYMDWHYEDGLIDKRFFINLFILRNLITQMTEYSSHGFGQISSSTVIEGSKIRVIVEHDVNEETLYD